MVLRLRDRLLGFFDGEGEQELAADPLLDVVHQYPAPRPLEKGLEKATFSMGFPLVFLLERFRKRFRVARGRGGLVHQGRDVLREHLWCHHFNPLRRLPHHVLGTSLAG